MDATLKSYQQLLVSKRENALVLYQVTKELMDETTVWVFGNELFEIVEQDDRDVIILSSDAVTFYNSSALGKLHQAHRKATKHGKQLILCAVSPEVMGYFTITRLHRVFKIAADEKDALAGQLMTPEECSAMAVSPI